MQKNVFTILLILSILLMNKSLQSILSDFLVSVLQPVLDKFSTCTIPDYVIFVYRLNFKSSDISSIRLAIVREDNQTLEKFFFRTNNFHN